MKKLYWVLVIAMAVGVAVACGQLSDRQDKSKEVSEESIKTESDDERSDLSVAGGGSEEKSSKVPVASSRSVLSATGRAGAAGESGMTEKKSEVIKTRLIIKTAQVSYEVENYNETIKSVTAITDSLGGFISDSKIEYPYPGVHRGTVELRVPAEHFETALIRLKTLSKKIESERIKGSDVTEEFYDLEARLVNKKKAEARFQEILKTAKTVREILDVERELTEVRENIERMEGRKRFLADQTSFSTITLTVHEPYPVAVSASGGFWATIGEGFKEGFVGFAHVLRVLIVILIAGIPLWALLFFIGWLIVKLIKRSKRKKVVAVASGTANLQP